MLVNRRTWIAKVGHQQEAIELLKAEMTRVFPSMTVRYYQWLIGPFDTFGCEAEFESLAAYEEAMSESASRVSPEVFEKWHQVREAGGTNELWELV